jgi:hypothetical protein
MIHRGGVPSGAAALSSEGMGASAPITMNHDDRNTTNVSGFLQLKFRCGIEEFLVQ